MTLGRRAPFSIPSLFALVAAATLTSALPGCVDYLAPDVGPLLPPPCQDADSDPAVEVSYALDVQAAIFDGPCRRCHYPDSANPIGLRRSGLDLSSHATLLRGGINSQQTIVVAGQPCQSVLYQKLVEGPPFGSRMPFDGPPYLSDEELARVHDWIAEGAHE